MKKNLPFFLMAFIFFSLGWSLWQTKETVMLGFQLKSQEERLTHLDERQGELEAEYLQFTLASVEPYAEQAGFIAIVTPGYALVDEAIAVR
ncbi:MAG: hypothetical protein HYT34_01760 [Candidatus Ryanbacteria bacterium]|nr:hypothetical protein [Candidatus Ryanbacteria bacterium]